jgi:catechol 2,3-dioxygenase-like lactoylglutathione lyase family enzyme
MRLSYAIKYVDDMDKAVAFHRDVLGLKLGFQSPFWTEFETGETKLALHPVTGEHKAGEVQLGFRSDDLDGFYGAREANGVEFTMPPTPQHGQTLARFRDCEGAETTVSG